eukprot:gene10699-11838_t
MDYSKKLEEEEKRMDSFYSWLVCFVSFLAGFIVIGFYISFGTIFVALIDQFDATESSAAWVGSSSFCILCVSLTLVNMLLPRIGFRAVSCLGSILFGSGLLLSSLVPSLPVLFVTYGVIFGLGSSMVNYSGLFILPRFFKRKRGLAFGIALSGHGIGALPMGYLTEHLIEEFGLRVALRLLALFALPLFAGSLVYGSTAVLDEKQSLEEKPGRSIVTMKTSSAAKESFWKNKALLVHSLAAAVNAFGYYIPVVHLVNMAEGLGVSPFQATILPSTIAISQSIGKILFGQLLTWFQGTTKLVALVQVCILLSGLVTTMCPLMTDFTGLLAYAILFGLFDACPSVVGFKIIENLVGESNINAGYAIQSSGMAFFLLIGPPTAGFLKEVTGSYRIPFALSGGFATICVCIMFLTPVLHKKAARKHTNGKTAYFLEYELRSSSASTSSENSFSGKCSLGSIDSGINIQIEGDDVSVFSSPSLSSFSSTTESIEEAALEGRDISTTVGCDATKHSKETVAVFSKNTRNKCIWMDNGDEDDLDCIKSTVIVLPRETVV